ncbi:sigma-E processing peptidase SpoIIGA [Solibacillus sp. FSL R7-0682]|uniref:sigma-E processing peptidase SpoIIGA n=1 Tax=Solibacillus sp. FSL R7-0682 TaxID=2921690 RepID=UPI0030FC09BD
MFAEWIFLFNVLLNVVLLRFTQAVTNKSIPTWRMILSAICSALIAIIFYGNVVMTFLSFIVLIGLAFSFQWRSFIQQGSWLVIATFLAGGLLTAVQSYLWSDSFLVYILLCSCIVCISFILVKKGWLLKIQRAIQNQYVTHCEIQLSNDTLQLLAYIDTGNECIEPLSQSPVHFISYKAVKNQLQTEFQESLLQWSEHEPLSLEMFPKELKKIIRIIPLTTVQQRTTLVPAFRANIRINEQTFSNHYVVFTKNDALFPQNAQMIAHVIVLINS